jgi:hypothetical protein
MVLLAHKFCPCYHEVRASNPMIQDPVKRIRLRSVLIILILATIPCYLLGIIIIWIGNTAKSHMTVTPTITQTESALVTEVTPTLPGPTALFATPTITLTPTETVSPTVTSTYFIPSSTPSKTPTPTFTLTPTDTLIPTETVDTPAP